MTKEIMVVKLPQDLLPKTDLLTAHTTCSFSTGRVGIGFSAALRMNKRKFSSVGEGGSGQ